MGDPSKKGFGLICIEQLPSPYHSTQISIPTSAIHHYPSQTVTMAPQDTFIEEEEDTWYVTLEPTARASRRLYHSRGRLRPLGAPTAASPPPTRWSGDCSEDFGFRFLVFRIGIGLVDVAACLVSISYFCFTCTEYCGLTRRQPAMYRRI